MLMLSLTIVYKLQYKKNIPMNDKTIIELVVSQNHHDLSVFRSSVVCLCLRKANCLSLLLTIVNFSSLSI